MLRLVLMILATLGVLWVVVALGVLPPPLHAAAQWVVMTAASLACPLFFLSLWVAPGLYREANDTLRHFWERLRTRRHEVEELQRKIVHLDKPHHMVQLGQVYARQGRSAKAAPWFARALEREPDLLEAQYRLALCHFDRGEYQPALELLERVHQAKPDHDYGLAYLRLAQSHLRLNNLDRAAAVFEKLLRFYPAQPEGSYYFALLLAQRGDRDRARALMRDVVFAVRHSPRFHRRRNRHWLLKAKWWLWRNRG